MAEAKYARTSTIVDGIRVTTNDTWDANDPFVKKHPELFSDEPMWLRHTVPTAEESAARAEALGLPRVEAATKAPGEMRKR